MIDYTQKSPLNILVTGVGAIIGYGIIKSIRQSKIPVRIIGTDIYADAVGQHWCDIFIQAKYAVDPDYISFIRDLINRFKIDLVFLGTEQEIYRISENRAETGKDIDKFVLNHTDILDLSKDKWRTINFLEQNNLREYAIPSVINGDYDSISKQFGKEFLLKPRSSYASKGIVRVADHLEFSFFKERMGQNFMAQRIVGDIDHEYTMAVFGLGNGTYSASIALKRKLSQDGSTAKAEIVLGDSFLEEATERLCKIFRPIGPTNLQFRLEHGKHYLLEINPRISSSTSIRTAFGYNEAEMCIRYFLFGEIVKPEVRAGRATRYINEVVTIIS